MPQYIHGVVHGLQKIANFDIPIEALINQNTTNKNNKSLKNKLQSFFKKFKPGVQEQLAMGGTGGINVPVKNKIQAAMASPIARGGAVGLGLGLAPYLVSAALSKDISVDAPTTGLLGLAGAGAGVALPLLAQKGKLPKKIPNFLMKNQWVAPMAIGGAGALLKSLF